jgi:hypothetical protein
MKNIKVRFNLSAGKNYMKWKVEYPDRKPEYYDPNEVQLRMVGCTLRNHRKTAQKINDGAHKTVCAWVLCKAVIISDIINPEVNFDNQLKYNPRKLPYWFMDENVNVDNINVSKIVSLGNKLFIN